MMVMLVDNEFYVAITESRFTLREKSSFFYKETFIRGTSLSYYDSVAHHSYHHHRAYHMVRCHVGMDHNIKLKDGIIL